MIDYKKNVLAVIKIKQKYNEEELLEAAPVFSEILYDKLKLYLKKPKNIINKTEKDHFFNFRYKKNDSLYIKPTLLVA